jgi:hypothetical protein
MISMFLALAAQAASPAIAPRPLQSQPGVTVQYYDVAGEDADTIKASLERAFNATKLYNWSLGMGINKRTEGTTCTITGATATMKATVNLPRLTGGDKIPSDVAKSFGDYVKSQEQFASDNLWFVSDHLPAMQQALVGKPCDGVQTLWDQQTANLVNEQKAFALAHATKKQRS